VGTAAVLAERKELASGEAGETGPVRRCVATGERAETERMIRFVLGPDHTLVPDLAERLPGRGIWLMALRSAVDDPRLARAVARAAKAPVVIPPALRQSLERLLVQRIADHLALARRAGQAVAGFVAARDWVTSGRARLIVEASDGALEGRRKLLSGARDLAVVSPLTAAELGQPFGRDHVVHVAVARGRLAEAIARDARRLAGVRGEAQEGGARKDRLGG